MKNYIEVTKKWKTNKKNNICIVGNATSVKINGIRYKTNLKNKIIHENSEEYNGKWLVNKIGGKLLYLPTINECEGIQCADYIYYRKKYSKGLFIEEKETFGKGKNVFYHALENKEKQADIFLIDCSKSNFSNKEILKRVNYIFKYRKTEYVKTVIIKNKNRLFGIYERKKRSGTL